jgi:hypothetical protein
VSGWAAFISADFSSPRCGPRAGLLSFGKRIRRAAGVRHQPPEGGEHAGGLATLTVNSKRRVYHPDSSPRIHPRFTTLNVDARDGALRSCIGRARIVPSDFTDSASSGFAAWARNRYHLGGLSVRTSSSASAARAPLGLLSSRPGLTTLQAHLHVPEAIVKRLELLSN